MALCACMEVLLLAHAHTQRAIIARAVRQHIYINNGFLRFASNAVKPHAVCGTLLLIIHGVARVWHGCGYGWRARAMAAGLWFAPCLVAIRHKNAQVCMQFIREQMQALPSRGNRV